MALVLHHLHYPVDDWRRRGGSYFTTERIEETWSMGLQVAYRRAPLSTLVDEFGRAGFVVEKLVEPRPTETMKHKYPEAYEKLSRVPAFIAFQLMKHPGSIK